MSQRAERSADNVFGALLRRRSTLIAVAALTALGFAIRVANFDQSLIGDELSTYWILDGNGLGDVLSSVRSDDEITPPLYFVLAWLTMKIGPDPEWVRLPSLIAGTATIPLVYLLGARTIGSRAGLVGAAVFALSPFVIYYATEARSYALMLLLLTASTLALLAAVRDRRARWWAVYGICSTGAMLSHYTALFPLAAQLVWALWFHRDAIRPLVLANIAALALFSPWIPGFIADNNSPTTEILAALSPFTADFVWQSVRNWAIGFPYVQLDVVPGDTATVMLVAAFLIAAVALAARGVLWLRDHRPPIRDALRRIPPGVALIALLALAAPLGEALYSALGSDILGARNLNSSWPGLAVGLGAIVSAAGPLLSVACTAAMLSGFAIGAAKTLEADTAKLDAKTAAEVIEERSEPGDVVVDTYVLTPVPLTPLDVHLPQTHPEYRLGLPASDEPFTVFDPVPPPNHLIREALRSANGRPIFLVAPVSSSKLVDPGSRAAEDRQEQPQALGSRFLDEARPRFRITYATRFDGIAPLGLFQFEKRERSQSPDR